MTIERYYDQMKNFKVQPDEMNLLLVSKMVCRNISVVVSKSIWSIYENAQPDIVIGYKGRDKKKRQGKWVGTITFRDPTLRSKFKFKFFFFHMHLYSVQLIKLDIIEFQKR